MIKKLIFSAFCVVFFFPVKAQTTIAGQQKAYALLDKAFGGIGENEDYAIYFEAISYRTQNPIDIFTLPSYKVYKGGHLYNYKNKFEIATGQLKALSDGKIMVIVSEADKKIIIDSVRKSLQQKKITEKDFNKLLGEGFTKSKLSYEGTEIINKKKCHKIKSASSEMPGSYVYYWIEVTTSKLILIGEWQASSFDTYWIKRIGKTPSGYSFNIKLPRKETTKMYGYEVFDFRYTSNSKFGIK